jgi:hypothetical protein
MKNQEPDYENEAEYKYPAIVLIILILGLLLKRILS